MRGTAEIRVVPANHATWAHLQSIFGTRGDAARCQCQWYKVHLRDWRSVPIEERAHRLREQTDCGHPQSRHTTGLVAYLGEEPVGWCAVEPRSEYPHLHDTRVPWQGRDEDPHDPSVWAVTCFVVRAGYRRQGVSYALARAAVDLARERGAAALEGYPMLTTPGRDVTWSELHVGSHRVFEAAGLREVSHPTARRVVMRIDFGPPGLPVRRRRG